MGVVSALVCFDVPHIDRNLADEERSLTNLSKPQPLSSRVPQNHGKDLRDWYESIGIAI